MRHTLRARPSNRALWLGGCPDHSAHRHHRRGAPDLDYYDELGARGFALAAEHRLSLEHGLRPLLSEASRRYLALRVALNAVSDALLFPHRHTPDRLLRQVRDGARLRQTS